MHPSPKELFVKSDGEDKQNLIWNLGFAFQIFYDWNEYCRN